MLTLSRHEESRAAADSAAASSSSSSGSNSGRRRGRGRPRRSNDQQRSGPQDSHRAQQPSQHQHHHHHHHHDDGEAAPSHAHDTARLAGDLHDLLELDGSDAAAAAAASMLLNEVFQAEMSPPSTSALRALYAGLDDERHAHHGGDEHDVPEDMGFFLSFLEDEDLHSGDEGDGFTLDDGEEYLWGNGEEPLDLDTLEPTMLNDGSFVLMNGSHSSQRHDSPTPTPATAATAAAAAPATTSTPTTTAATPGASSAGVRPRPSSPQRARFTGKTRSLQQQAAGPPPATGGKTDYKGRTGASTASKAGARPVPAPAPAPLAGPLSDSGSEVEPATLSEAGLSVPPSPAIKGGVPLAQLTTASTLQRAAGALRRRRGQAKDQDKDGRQAAGATALEAALETGAFAAPSSLSVSPPAYDTWEHNTDADIDVDLVLFAADADADADADAGLDLDLLTPLSSPGPLDASEGWEPALVLHRRPRHTAAGLAWPSPEAKIAAMSLESLQETLLAALGGTGPRRYLVLNDPAAADASDEAEGSDFEAERALAVSPLAAVTHPLQLISGMAAAEDGSGGDSVSAATAALASTDPAAAAAGDVPPPLVLNRALNATARNGGARSWLYERDNRMAACASPPPPLLCVRKPPPGIDSAGNRYLRFRPEARLAPDADALVQKLWSRRPLRSEAAAAAAAAAADAGSVGAPPASSHPAAAASLATAGNFAEDGSDCSDDDDSDCDSQASQEEDDAIGYVIGIFDSDEESSSSDEVDGAEVLTFYALSRVRRKRRHRGSRSARASKADSAAEEEGEAAGLPSSKRAKLAGDATGQPNTASRSGSALQTQAAAGGKATAATLSATTAGAAGAGAMSATGATSAAAAAALAGIPAGQGAPITPMQKRAMHNVLERKRREDLRASYRALRSSIPELTNNERASASVILHAASAYIAKLKQEDAYLVAQLRQLRGPSAAPLPTASETYGAHPSSRATPTPRAQTPAATATASYAHVQPVRFPGYV